MLRLKPTDARGGEREWVRLGDISLDVEAGWSPRCESRPNGWHLPGDDDLGQEITPTLQWMVNRDLYVQSLVLIVIPGRGLKQVLPEPARTWKNVQLSFSWFF